MEKNNSAISRSTATIESMAKNILDGFESNNIEADSATERNLIANGEVAPMNSLNPYKKNKNIRVNSIGKNLIF